MFQLFRWYPGKGKIIESTILFLAISICHLLGEFDFLMTVVLVFYLLLCHGQRQRCTHRHYVMDTSNVYFISHNYGNTPTDTNHMIESFRFVWEDRCHREALNCCLIRNLRLKNEDDSAKTDSTQKEQPKDRFAREDINRRLLCSMERQDDC